MTTEGLARCPFCQNVGVVKDMYIFKKRFFHPDCLSQHKAMRSYEEKWEIQMLVFFSYSKFNGDVIEQNAFGVCQSLAIEKQLKAAS